MDLELVRRILIYVVSVYTAGMGVGLLIKFLIISSDAKVTPSAMFEAFYYMYEFTWSLDSLGLYSL